MLCNTAHVAAFDAAEVTYVGEDGGYHAFRMNLSPLKPLKALAAKTNVQAWIINNADGDAVCGNGFDGSRYPAFGDADGKALFILFNRLDDVERFEEVFPVHGFSPTLVH